MKRFLFSMLALVALVLMANTTFAQSTPAAPYEGATHTYTVDGITVGDTWEFIITDDAITSDPSSSVLSATNHYAFETSATGTNTGSEAVNDTATVDISWGNLAEDDGPFNLWIVVQDQTTNCYNYRYVTITPTANQLDFTIASIGLDDDVLSNLTLATDSTNALGEECAVPVGFDYDATGSGAGDNGRTYAYFRVERSNGTDGDSWSFSFDATVSDSIQYSDGGTTWAAYTGGDNVSVEATDNVEYFRVARSLTTSTQTVTGTITGAAETTSGLDDGDSPESSSIDILALPAVGNFGF